MGDRKFYTAHAYHDDKHQDKAAKDSNDDESLDIHTTFTLLPVLLKQAGQDSGAKRQSIRCDGRLSPDVRLLLRAEVRRHLAHDRYPLGVGTAKRADGPVTGEDQSL